MSTPGPVLELADVELRAPSGELLLEPCSLRVAAGEQVLVRVPRGPQSTPLADACVGIEAPERGTVRFRGQDWRELRPSDAASARHAIGRVHLGTEWVSNLDVDENVILGCCHHTRRPEADIVEEALALARDFGLSELTDRRPDRVGLSELRAYALVRALLGSPALLLLERPLRGVAPTLAQPLLGALKAARSRGAAVLWFSSEEGLFGSHESDETGADLRYVLDGTRLRPLGGDRS